jgi:hypothetical protein
MRLTLRTLLAYLDNVLDPSEKASLGDKISKSQTSRGIIERIRRVLASPNLSAPKIGTPNSTNDPNPIAEYLDNTHPSTKISEIEVQCLNDDARLAEVAACHQILTLALNKPASVPPELKTKIVDLQSSYQLSSNFTGKTKEDLIEPISSLPKTVEIGGKQVRVDAPIPALRNIEDNVLRAENVRPLPSAGIELDDNLAQHVPEYLRKGTSKDWGTPAAIFALVTSLLFVAWISLGSWDELQNLINPSTPPVVLNERGEKIPEQQTTSADSDIPKVVEDSNATLAPTVDVPVVTQSTEHSGTAQNDLASIEMIKQGLETKPTDTSLPPETPSDRSVASLDPGSNQATPIPAKPVPPNEPSAQTQLESSGFLRWQPQTDEEAKIKIVLVQSEDPAKETWRLKAGESLQANQRLIVPASMRTAFEVSSGLRWLAADESMLASENQESSQIPKIKMSLGRALVESNKPPHKLIVSTPQQELKLEFQDEKSTITIELRYLFNKGYRLDDPKEGAPAQEELSFATPVLRVCSLRGSTRVSSLNSEPIVLSVAEGLEWQGQDVFRHWSIPSMNDVPWWYENTTMRPIDNQALEELQTFLNKMDPATSAIRTLQEIEQLRFAEISLIAVRARLLLGDYSNIFGTEGFLSKPSSRAHRTVLLETLFQSVASRPEGSRHLVEHITTTEPARALRLLDLLSLASDEQLAEGADRRFVEGLSSPFLDERALSIYQLKTIIGKEFGYQSERPSNESVQTWKRLLSSGKIRWSKK